LSIDFNSVIAQVIFKGPGYIEIRVLVGGKMGQNKAVTLDWDISLPSLTAKDIKALSLGRRLGIRHAALSFAAKAADVDQVRAILGSKSYVISKIESIRGVLNLEEIALNSDALLIDRGDLSRQVPLERLPAVQKDIISRAKKCKAKIYVATNLLESMISSPFPTRAEVNDIFNTLNDGADGLVLAAETAIGRYPINCVNMVSRVVKQFLNFSKRSPVQDLKSNDSFLLVEPHGGKLVNRLKDDISEKQLRGLKVMEVDLRVIFDAEQIALGTFSPLEGFMHKDEIDSVLANYRLPNGVIWPLPVFLQVSKSEAKRFKRGDDIALALRKSGEIYAVLHLEDIYSYDLNRLCEETYLTSHSSHPAVDLLKRNGEFFLAGKVDLIRRFPSLYKYFEITPKQTRSIFENKGWGKVVGFHTRNVIHRIHEYIQMYALEKYHCDGLFVHPVVGPKKSGDYNSGIILRSYEQMIDKHYPQGRVVLGAFQSYSRYAGPREAIFTALCRKNFGCSHFIVGRDHTGLGGFYKTYDSHKLFERLGDIGIVPIFFGKINYCEKCGNYVEKCKHADRFVLNISGSEGRNIFNSNRMPPGWFMRTDISGMVLGALKRGEEVFIR